MISSVVVSPRERRSEHGSGVPDPDGGGGAPRGGRVGIETLGRSTFPARFLKPGKYSHVTWLGGNKAKY